MLKSFIFRVCQLYLTIRMLIIVIYAVVISFLKVSWICCDSRSNTTKCFSLRKYWHYEFDHFRSTIIIHHLYPDWINFFSKIGRYITELIKCKQLSEIHYLFPYIICYSIWIYLHNSCPRQSLYPLQSRSRPLQSSCRLHAYSLYPSQHLQRKLHNLHIRCHHPQLKIIGRQQYII